MSLKTRPDRAEMVRLRNFICTAMTRRGGLGREEELYVSAGMADLRVLRAGVELIAEGALLNEPLLLADGWAVRQRILSDGRRQIYSFVLPGDAFGLCARTGATALYSTFALTPVTVAAAPFLAATQRMDGVLTELAWSMLALEENSVANQVMRLGRQSAYERLINLLLEFYHRLDAVGLAQDNAFAMPITQEVLSDALGLSVVHTNRTLQQLRREHLIETRGANMRLNDLQLLAEIGDFRQPADLGRC